MRYANHDQQIGNRNTQGSSLRYRSKHDEYKNEYRLPWLPQEIFWGSSVIWRVDGHMGLPDNLHKLNLKTEKRGPLSRRQALSE